MVDAGSDFSTFQALFLITAMQITISYISPLRTKLQILHRCSDVGMADSCLHINDGKTEVLVCAPDTFVVGKVMETLYPWCAKCHAELELDDHAFISITFGLLQFTVNLS